MPLYRVSLVREQTIPVTVRANSKEDAAALAEDLYDKDILDDGFGSESDGYDSDLTRVYEATAYDDRGTVYDADSIKHKLSDEARRYVADILRLATKQIPDAEIGSIGDCHPSDEDVISVATEPPSGDLGSRYEAGQLLADGFPLRPDQLRFGAYEGSREQSDQPVQLGRLVPALGCARLPELVGVERLDGWHRS